MATKTIILVWCPLRFSCACTCSTSQISIKQWCFLSHYTISLLAAIHNSVDPKETQTWEHNWNDRCLWNPSGVLCCHRVCSGTQELSLITLSFLIFDCFNCLELANFSENACLRENCLRCSRMINAFQKNKFRQLLSSWYALHSGSEFFPHHSSPVVLANFPSWFHHISFQVKALYYLHSNRIIHRDMKPQNILIGKGSIVKVNSVPCWHA